MQDEKMKEKRRTEINEKYDELIRQCRMGGKRCIPDQMSARKGFLELESKLEIERLKALKLLD